jgi:sugar/nucleoside kinase (ribokinase family)
VSVLVVGDVLTDTIVQLHAPLRPGGDAASIITDTPGGQGANVSRWLVAAGVAEVRLLAAASTADPIDHDALLRAARVTPELVLIDAPVARIVVIVEPDGNERSFLTQRGAGALLDEADADTVSLTGVEWCHVSGYLLSSEAGRRCYARLHTRCASLNIPLSVDPASISELLNVGPKRFLELVGQVHLLTPNDAEAFVLTGSHDPGSAAKLLLDSASIVAVTCGAGGVVSNSKKSGPLRLPATASPVVDPTGAGDAFAAGLIRALVSDASLIDALRNGVRLGAEAVTQTGAAPKRGQN